MPIRPQHIAPDLLELILTATEQYAGWRADRFVAHRIPRLSRNRIQRIFETRAFNHRGQPLKPNHRMRIGEEISLYRRPPDEPVPKAELVVLYEDDYLIAIDKPAGLTVHPTARHHHNTVTWLLEQRYGSDQRPRLAHRLDAETSGVLLCAKDLITDQHMKKAFANRLVQKQYLAVVRGIPSPDRGRIEKTIAPNPHSIVKARMWCGDPCGMPSLTEYEILSHSTERAFLRLTPRTGRQHQLRVHLDSIGHPIVGDKLYGPDDDLFLDYLHNGMTSDILRRAGHPRQALHACRLSFTHPMYRKPVCIEAPLPDDLKALLTGFTNREAQSESSV